MMNVNTIVLISIQILRTCVVRGSAGHQEGIIKHSIDYEQTKEDSLTDPLTGLPNTRFLFMHVIRELARAERLKSEVSLLVMDSLGYGKPS
jgi:GGDEF domain-containing protein